MHDLAWALMPVAVIAIIGLSHAMRGPLGKALADRIAGRAGGRMEGEVASGDVDELRQRLAELEERLDFTERVLARAQEPHRVERSEQ